MKKILLSLSLFLSITLLNAQYYYVPNVDAGENPKKLNIESENPAAASGGPISKGWQSIWSGPSSAAVAYSSVANLPFSFKFNGATVTKYKASNCGFVTFSTSSTTLPANYNVLTLPSASVPDSSICVSGIKPINNSTFQSQIITKTFGTAPNRQHWIQFNFFTDPNIQSGWTYWAIVLEETTNNIYIVDMKTLCVTSNGYLCTSNTKLSAGIQINSSTAYTVSGSPNLGSEGNTENKFDESDNSYYTFYNGTQPSLDVEGKSSNVPDFLALAQAPFNISGLFKNIGSSNITSADVNYSINNGTPVTASAGSINIVKFATATVTSPTTWTPASVGFYTIKMWLSNLNSSSDEVTSNDTITKIVEVLANFSPRIPLHEVFTSSTCGPCRAGNNNLDNIVLPNIPGQYTCIKYQMSWPGTGDPYCTSEGQTRRSLYAVNSIPNMQVDGGWNQNAGSYNLTLFNQFKQKPSFIKIEATHKITFKKVEVDVKITPYKDYNNSNLKLFVVLAEKKTTKNKKTNGETEFFNVMKKMLPNANGTSIGSITKDVAKTFPTMTYVIPGDYRLPIDGQSANTINVNTENSIEELTDCEVIVFIQDLSTKEVYQSANSVGTVSAIDYFTNSSNLVNIYPNPSTNGYTNISFNLSTANNVNISIYNNLGQQVSTTDYANLEAGKNTVSLNTSNLPKGIYTVNVQGGSFHSTQKLIVE